LHCRPTGAYLEALFLSGFSQFYHPIRYKDQTLW